MSDALALMNRLLVAEVRRLEGEVAQYRQLLGQAADRLERENADMERYLRMRRAARQAADALRETPGKRA